MNPGFSKASDDFPDISPKLETVAALLVVLGFVIVQNDQDSVSCAFIVRNQHSLFGLVISALVLSSSSSNAMRSVL